MYPHFTDGAYAPDAIYGHAEVSEVVDYAWERGIRWGRGGGGARGSVLGGKRSPHACLRT